VPNPSRQPASSEKQRGHCASLLHCPAAHRAVGPSLEQITPPRGGSAEIPGAHMAGRPARPRFFLVPVKPWWQKAPTGA
ncbi:hypothetical protein KZ308_28915, partial [Escherichia coli]|nr:hypothetical protein [Escherichia coli]